MIVSRRQVHDDGIIRGYDVVDDVVFSVFLLKNGRLQTIIDGQKLRVARGSMLLARIPRIGFRISTSTFYGFNDRSLKIYISKYYRMLLDFVEKRQARKTIGQTHFNPCEIISPSFWKPSLFKLCVEKDMDVVRFCSEL